MNRSVILPTALGAALAAVAAVPVQAAEPARPEFGHGAAGNGSVLVTGSHLTIRYRATVN